MAIHPGLNSRYTVDQKKGEKTMAYLKGYVDHIRFRNEDNGYTVLSLDVDGDEETVVGSFPFLNDGEYISWKEISRSPSAWTTISDENL